MIGGAGRPQLGNAGAAQKFAGNPKARTIMLELAWLWIRYQPDSPFTIWFSERVGTAKGSQLRDGTRGHAFPWAQLC